MKIHYYDSKAETRLEAYADTVVLETEGYTSYIAAIRFGGYPESVKGMTEAIYGGGSVTIDIDGTPVTAYSRVKQYRRELSHDSIYAEATLMIRDDEQRQECWSCLCILPYCSNWSEYRQNTFNDSDVG